MKGEQPKGDVIVHRYNESGRGVFNTRKIGEQKAHRSNRPLERGRQREVTRSSGETCIWIVARGDPIPREGDYEGWGKEKGKGVGLKVGVSY